MVAMATTRCFCDGSISENVKGRKLYKCTKFHALMKKWTLFSHITWTKIYFNESSILSIRQNFQALKVGIHDTGFLPISDMPIADTNIFPFVWKQHQVSPVEIINKLFLILVSFSQNTC